MLTEERRKALKTITEAAEILHYIQPINVTNCSVRLNSYFECSEVIKYCLEILNVQHEVYTPSMKPLEFNLCVGKEVNPQVIYSLVYLIDKIISDSKLYLYICHATKERSPLEIIAGSYITPQKRFFNVSRRIDASEFLALNATSLTSIQIGQMFPNARFHSSGACMAHDDEDDNYLYERNRDYDEDNHNDDDSWGGNHHSEYYDDNLDMDQQSQEYWDNL
jgi:hypothetical protein